MSYVEGLKIMVPGDELYEHLMARVAHHSEKADHYARASTGVKEAQEEDVDEANAYSNNPRISLARSEKDHRRQARYFKFMADHLDRSTHYQLDQNDLMKVEIMDR